MAEHTSEIRNSPKSRRLGWLAGRLMEALCSTLRIEVIDRCGITRPGGIQGPVLYCLWHDSIFVMPAAWRRACGSHRTAAVLTSASNDGAILANAAAVFGLGAVRGSSSRRGAAAMVALRRVLRQGQDVCITPDGPRGPHRVLQPGIVKLAETGGVPIVPVRVCYGAAWRLKSWDRFQIPKPFSSVRVIFDTALAVPGGLAENEFGMWCSQIAAVMRSGENETLSDDPR